MKQTHSVYMYIYLNKEAKIQENIYILKKKELTKLQNNITSNKH